MTSNALTTIVLCFALAIAAAFGGFMYANSTHAAAAPAPPAATAPVDPTPTPEPTKTLKTYAPEHIEDAENEMPDGYIPEWTNNEGIDNYDLDPAEQQYVITLQNYYGVDFSAVEESDWVVDGRNSICFDFDYGSTTDQVISGYSDQRGISETTGEFIVATAIDAFCPEYA